MFPTYFNPNNSLLIIMLKCSLLFRYTPTLNYRKHNLSRAFVDILSITDKKSGFIAYKHTHIKDVRANCFCASLLRTRITCHGMPRHASSARARYKNEQMIRQMAIATTLLGFNDLGRSVTPSFLSETHFIYNYLHIVQK